MRRRVSVLLLAPLLLSGTRTWQQPDFGYTGQAAILANLERRMLRAEVAQDQEFFRRLELCHYRFIGWRGEQLTKADDLAAVAEPRPGRVVAFGVAELVIREYGQTALVWGLDTIVTQRRGRVTEVGRSRFTHVYLRQGGRWRLAAAHASPVGAR